MTSDNQRLLGQLTAITRVGSGDLLGGVTVSCLIIMLTAWKQMSRLKNGSFAVSDMNVFEAFCVKWTLMLLAVCFYLKGDCMKLASKALLAIVALLKFQRVFFECCFDFFGVHKSKNAAKPPNRH